jgi:ubiquinone/menaquinone biosynthesis C-methylase UbiE
MSSDVIPGLNDFKRHTRAMWAAGDFPAVAQRDLWAVGERLVRRIGVGRGERVLDVACGSGNVAIRAAEAGGQVHGLDLTPELFAAGRRLAEQAGVHLEWVEGDAESLPFVDGGFDVVLSAFGCMFAPRHRIAATELVRVLRPGGRLGVCSWTPEGIQGDFFRLVGSYLPPGPAFAEIPLLWGSEAHVRDIFDGFGMQLDFDRELVEGEPFESAYDAVDFLATNFGPLLMLRRALEASGQWPELREQLATLYGSGGAAEYLVVTGRKAGSS